MDAARPATFGTLLRRYRLAADLTQEQLAERAHVSRRSIGDLERDGPHTPRKDTVALLAETLALSPRERGGFVEAARQIGVPSRESRAALHGALYGSASAPFVGRRLELALLERHLAGEGPPVLLVAGEPGIGKSRLLREAAPHAHDCGWTVLAGGCQRQGGQVPYAPVLGALKRHLQAQRAGSLRAALAGCAWLARLLPELETGTIAPLPRLTLPPEQERRLMFDAVARFLGNVAGPAGQPCA
jgi:transcriptional regulator with XRE-family HTH domain